MFKVTKKVAEEKFNAGLEICVLPSKLNPASEYGKSMTSWITKPADEPNAFEKLCNAVRYYNCSKELGMGLAYYVKEA